MFEMKRKTATKFGVAVTSIVFLAACSHSAVQTEAIDEQPIPVSEFSQPTPEPEAALPAAAPTAMPELRETPSKKVGTFKKKKKKVRYVKHSKKKKSLRKLVRHEKKKKDAAPIVTAQVNDQLPPAPPAPPSEIAPMPQTPVPPAFDTQALQGTDGGFFSHWGMWIALVGAIGLGLAGVYRTRLTKTTRHRLIFK